MASANNAVNKAAVSVGLEDLRKGAYHEFKATLRDIANC